MLKNKDFLFAALLALVLSFLLFGNGLGGKFVFDDTIVIVGSPFIGNGIGNFWEIFTNPYFAYQPRPGLFRPLTIASYAVNAFLFGMSPVSFHVINVLLHALVSYLVFLLFYRLGGRIVAFSGFLFFMFLPIHVEAVTSIVGRAEILSLLFSLGALLFALKQKYILASGSFLLGLLSKEMAMAFLPIFLFLEFFWFKTKPRVVLKKIIYFLPAIAVYALLRYLALGKYFLSNDATPVHNPIKFAPLFSGIWTSFKVFYLYLEKTFFPLHLSTDYSFDQIPLVGNPFLSLPTLFGVGIFILLILLFAKVKNFLLRFGIAAFLSYYFVISNWVFKTGTIMGERLMYAPSLGLALIAGIVINFAILKISNKKIIYGFLALVLVFYGLVIVDRNKDWLNAKNLFESAYATAPNSVVNQTNKAYLEFIQGDYEGSVKRLNEVLKMAPDHVSALNLAGQNYKKLGQYQKAEESWKKAVELRDDFLRAYLSLGILYYENGYNNSAEYILTRAIEIYPRWNEIFVLALTKVNLGKYEEAISLIKNQFGSEPARRELQLALGVAYFRKGDKGTAVTHFNRVRNPETSLDEFLNIIEKTQIYKIED